jgi:alkylated DNA repair dioxygenase AlkB
MTAQPRNRQTVSEPDGCVQELTSSICVCRPIMIAFPTQLALFNDASGPEGLTYRPEFITRAEEAELIARVRQLPLTPFQFGPFEGKRRVVSFGWHYDFSRQRLEEAEPFPEWIMPVIRAIERATALDDGAIRHVLFTEYEPGTGIGWHRDKKQFDKVFGLSLGAACDFRFRRKDGAKWQRFTLRAEPRSLYTMEGDARSVWEHSIPAVADLRYSVTFRTMA